MLCTTLILSHKALRQRVSSKVNSALPVYHSSTLAIFYVSIVNANSMSRVCLRPLDESIFSIKVNNLRSLIEWCIDLFITLLNPNGTFGLKAPYLFIIKVRGVILVYQSAARSRTASVLQLIHPGSPLLLAARY